MSQSLHACLVCIPDRNNKNFGPLIQHNYTLNKNESLTPLIFSYIIRNICFASVKIDQRKHINVGIGKTRSVLLNADYMMPGFAGMYM